MFSLEDAGDRHEEQSDAPQRAVSVDSSCAAAGTTWLGFGATQECRRRDVGRDCPQKGIHALAESLKI